MGTPRRHCSLWASTPGPTHGRQAVVCTNCGRVIFDPDDPLFKSLPQDELDDEVRILLHNTAPQLWARDGHRVGRKRMDPNYVPTVFKPHARSHRSE